MAKLITLINRMRRGDYYIVSTFHAQPPFMMSTHMFPASGIGSRSLGWHHWICYCRAQSLWNPRLYSLNPQSERLEKGLFTNPAILASVECS